MIRNKQDRGKNKIECKICSSKIRRDYLTKHIKTMKCLCSASNNFYKFVIWVREGLPGCADDANYISQNYNSFSKCSEIFRKL